MDKPKDGEGFTVLYRCWVVELDVRLNVALPAIGQGLRADTGKLSGLGATGGIPVPDALPGTRRKYLKTQRNKNNDS
ncbi:MAG: hypothetical protein OXC54_09295 [Rhodospirillaceae bacterium]|nr:hypothetical protein [Rhodospirillaceae bacterium]MCY4311486.1 hypothetical protein [Rhodospirillaceae bacterium]